MVVLNFGPKDASITLPFPKAGTWREMLDDDVRSASFDVTVAAPGELHSLTVPSHYGFVLIKIT